MFVGSFTVLAGELQGENLRASNLGASVASYVSLVEGEKPTENALFALIFSPSAVVKISTKGEHVVSKYRS